MRRGKIYLEAEKRVDKSKVYTLSESVEILKGLPSVKFDQSVEISCTLNIDPKKSDQMVRGSVMLPYGTGKDLKIMVFCEPDKENEAKEAGADYVGGEEFINKVLKEGWLDFDYCISTPQMMRIVSRLGKVLGPRGLMPSPKTGSVTENVSFAVNEAKKGKIDFRADKTGCIHAGVGKISFPKESLVGNIKAFFDALNGVRPAAVKGAFVEAGYISLTMSPSLKIEV